MACLWLCVYLAIGVVAASWLLCCLGVFLVILTLEP